MSLLAHEVTIHLGCLAIDPAIEKTFLQVLLLRLSLKVRTLLLITMYFLSTMPDRSIRSSLINKEEIIWRTVRHFVEGKKDSGESEDYFSPVFKEDRS